MIKALMRSRALARARTIRPFLFGYLAMWFLAGFILEIAGFNQRHLRDVANEAAAILNR